MIAQLEQQLEITKLPTEIVFNQQKEMKRHDDNRMSIESNPEKVSIDRQMSTTSSQPSIELAIANEINGDKITKPILVTESKKIKKVKKKKDEDKEKGKEKEKEKEEKEKKKKSKKKLKELKALPSESNDKNLDETRLDNKDTIVKFSKQQKTQEMLNNIDYIWDVNRLNLLLEDATQCLGSIKEELPIR
jgi:hypothetical protein